MTAIFLTMPEDPTDLSHWLERQLVSPDLRRLTEELAVVHASRNGPSPTRSPSLSEVLGANRRIVLESGLGRLPRQTLSQLLRWPPLLLELQEQILTEGGPYWDQVPAEPEVEQRTARIAEYVRETIAAEQSAVPSRRRLLTFGRLLSHAATALATAAAVLGVLYMSGFLSRPTENKISVAPNWGFAEVQQLPSPATDADTLERLAKLASEWSNKRPTDAAGLAQRLGEFRQGCAALQLSQHLPLSAPQRRWLSLRCGDWAAEMDAHLRRLEETRDVPGVQAAADRTVAHIVEELRHHAEAVRAA